MELKVLLKIRLASGIRPLFVFHPEKTFAHGDMDFH